LSKDWTEKWVSDHDIGDAQDHLPENLSDELVEVVLIQLKE
jgi:hypothetical protein